MAPEYDPGIVGLSSAQRSGPSFTVRIGCVGSNSRNVWHTSSLPGMFIKIVRDEIFFCMLSKLFYGSFVKCIKERVMRLYLCSLI